MSYRGIVLNKKNYSEADSLITILSRRKGRQVVVAKGVRRLKSRKRGHLEVFNLIDYSLSERNTNLPILVEAEVVEGFSDLRKSLNKVSLSYYFIEIVERLSRSSSECEELFDILLKYLRGVQNSKRLNVLKEQFVYEVVVTLGFWPRDKKLNDSSLFIKNLFEREMSSLRVGKRIFSVE